jgi:phosphoglycolate phosphatase-like HAD superfamily hydrolase
MRADAKPGLRISATAGSVRHFVHDNIAGRRTGCRSGAARGSTYGDIAMNTVKAESKPATAQDIRQIIGPFENEVIARILDVQPTIEEVHAAYVWLRSDEHLVRNLEHELRGKAAMVFEILDDEYPDFDPAMQPVGRGE